MDTELAPSPSLLQQCLDEGMLLEAWERVLRNDGCAGHDGQSVAAFAGDVSGQLRRIREEVLEGDVYKRQGKCCCTPRFSYTPRGGAI